MSKAEIAKVAHVPSSTSVIINKGRNQGISVGDRFLVFYMGDEIFDPDTKESLGRVEVVRGRAQATHVQDSISTLESNETISVSGPRKIVTREPTLGYYLSGAQREIVEEAAEEKIKALNSKIGDLAKKID